MKNATSSFKKSLLTLSVVASLALAGCSSTNAASSASSSIQASIDQGQVETVSTSSAGSISYDTHYDSTNLNWDQSSEVTIDLANPQASQGVSVQDGVITITAAGTYRLSGQLEDGQVRVEAGDQDTVRLVLDNASIHNSSGPALLIESADEAIVYSQQGSTNSLSDGADYADTSSEAADATLFSRADLTLAGQGSLNVDAAYSDGIASRDGLTIAAGSYKVVAKNHGIKGKDYVDIISGKIQVEAAEGDGIKATNADDQERGWLRLISGQLEISAADDALKAERELEILAGEVKINSATEGIEGQHIMISAGNISVQASEDAMNATIPSDSSSETEEGTETENTDQAGQQPAPSEGAEMPTDTGFVPGGMPGGMPGQGGMEEAVDASIKISGGNISLTTSAGDGFDSNGTAEISGGNLTVNGPSADGNGVFDTVGDFTISDATVIAGGTADMFVAPTLAKGAYLLTKDLTVTEADEITVEDANGQQVASYRVSAEGAQLFYVSSGNLVAGQTYTVKVNGQQQASLQAQS